MVLPEEALSCSEGSLKFTTPQTEQDGFGSHLEREESRGLPILP
jgi:hypothetical protein